MSSNLNKITLKAYIIKLILHDNSQKNITLCNNCCNLNLKLFMLGGQKFSCWRFHKYLWFLQIKGINGIQAKYLIFEILCIVDLS